MKYRTIVADPPWEHERTNAGPSTIGFSKTRRANPAGKVSQPLPYPTMTVEEIAALPIAELVHPSGAHLYLWTTSRYLRDSFEIVASWGFRYVSTQVWCKQPIPSPIGGAFRSNVEFFLFARRGNLKTLGYSSSRWFSWPRRRGAPVKAGKRRADFHSAKPEAFLDLVEVVSPAPRVELFARRQRLGWDTWGDEALEHVEMAS